MAAAAGAVRRPQPIEHHAHSSVSCGANVALPVLVIHKGKSRNTSNLFATFQLSSYPYLLRGDESSLFFCCRDFALSNGLDLFSRSKQNVYITHRIRPVRTLPRRNPGGERFAVLYQYTYILSSSPRIPGACIFPQLDILSLTLAPTTSLNHPLNPSTPSSLPGACGTPCIDYKYI